MHKSRLNIETMVFYNITGNWVKVPSCPSNRNADEMQTTTA